MRTDIPLHFITMYYAWVYFVCFSVCRSECHLIKIDRHRVRFLLRPFNMSFRPQKSFFFLLRSNCHDVILQRIFLYLHTLFGEISFSNLLNWISVKTYPMYAKTTPQIGVRFDLRCLVVCLFNSFTYSVMWPRWGWWVTVDWQRHICTYILVDIFHCKLYSESYIHIFKIINLYIHRKCVVALLNIQNTCLPRKRFPSQSTEMYTWTQTCSSVYQPMTLINFGLHVMYMYQN